MQLSKNFSLSEFLESQVARRKNIKEQFEPNKVVIDNLKQLVIHVLQPLRDKLGKSISISSGFRCKRLNKAIGGASTSHHLKGYAADIKGVGVSNKDLFNFIKDNFEFTELIWEYGTKDEPAWVHVSYIPNRLEKEVLYIGVKK